jgi:hypothetical protein
VHKVVLEDKFGNFQLFSAWATLIVVASVIKLDCEDAITMPDG